MKIKRHERSCEVDKTIHNLLICFVFKEHEKGCDLMKYLRSLRRIMEYK